MVSFRGARKFGKRAARGAKRTLSVLSKASRGAKTVLGKVDKFTGGAATKALQMHPYGMGALAAIEAGDAAGRVAGV